MANTKLKILLVDDDPSRVELLVDTFVSLGHAVRPARDLSLGLSNFDLVFVGENTLPDETIAAFKHKHPAIPVLGLAPRLSDVDPDFIIRSALDDVVTGPFTHTSLHAKIAIWSPVRETHSRLVVDLDPIRELEKLSQDDGSALVPTLIDLFHSSREEIAELERVFEDGELEDVRALAHKLKSSASSLGLVRLRCICQKIELGRSREDMRLPVALLPKEFELAKIHLTRAGYTAMKRSA